MVNKKSVNLETLVYNPETEFTLTLSEAIRESFLYYQISSEHFTVTKIQNITNVNLRP